MNSQGTPYKSKLEEYVKNGLVVSQRHNTFPLTIYNYSRFTEYEKLWNNTTEMARGLVIDDNGNIVARSYKKFFNWGERPVKMTSSYEVSEKLDGYLILLFNYKGQWIFSSRGSFHSKYSEAAKRIFESLYSYEKLDINLTYVFELVGKNWRIVVDYPFDEKIILTGVFDTNSGEEEGKDWGMETTTYSEKHVFPQSVTDELTNLFKTIPEGKEGFVVRFSNGERVKFKSEEYFNLHKHMTRTSTTSIWECLKEGKSPSEDLKDFPDEFFDKVKKVELDLTAKFYSKNLTIKLWWDCNQHLSEKEIANKLKGKENEHIIHAYRKGKDISQLIWKQIKPKWELI